MNETLALCPFCGGYGATAEHYMYGWHVRCVTCEATTTDFGDEESAIKAWNRRVGLKMKERPTLFSGEMVKVIIVVGD